MRHWRSVVALAVVACGAPARAPAVAPARDAPKTVIDRMLPLLPDGAQVVVELDLARLRANAVVGATATKALARLGADARLPGLPVAVQGSPIGDADAVVVAAYGVGTADAATVTLLATKEDVAGSVRLAPDVVALGPDEWTTQLATRAQIAEKSPLAAPAELMALRAHAMPAGATGAVVRITARLSFDARVALARQTGVDAAPARLSLWGDVADDLAIVVDADAADPGDKGGKDAARRLAHTFRVLLQSIAEEPVVRAVGVPNSLADARLIAQGTWVRAIIAIGPRHLVRAVERANALLQGAS